jgi:hypothetical protein
MVWLFVCCSDFLNQHGFRWSKALGLRPLYIFVLVARPMTNLEAGTKRQDGTLLLHYGRRNSPRALAGRDQGQAAPTNHTVAAEATAVLSGDEPMTSVTEIGTPWERARIGPTRLAPAEPMRSSEESSGERLFFTTVSFPFDHPIIKLRFCFRRKAKVMHAFLCYRLRRVEETT